MRCRSSVEEVMYLFSVYYAGMASEDWHLHAPLADLYVNIGFLFVTGGVAGTLYLLRKRRERAHLPQG